MDDRHLAPVRQPADTVEDIARGTRRQPDLWVRLYRDASVAEALSCKERPPWRAEEEGEEAHDFLSAQWRRNLLLGKWLEYLLDQGHGFDDVPVTPAAVAA